MVGIMKGEERRRKKKKKEEEREREKKGQQINIMIITQFNNIKNVVWSSINN